MILERSVSFEIRSDEASAEGDGLTLVGHAAVFNQSTEINSWEGRFLETIAPGAFRKTIRERTPVLQFDHGRHPLIGSIPIGTITSLSEDTEGLAVEARLSDNWLIEPVRMAIKERAVNGMSFRFEVIREEWRDKDGKIVKADELMQLLWDAGERGPLERTLKELKVPELGPVVFPAYTQTSVDVRARGIAELIRSQQTFIYEIRSALAQQSKPKLEDLETFKNDPELRSEVAKALLFADAPTTEGHSSESQHPLIKLENTQPVAPVTDHSTEEVTREIDAPTLESHSSPQDAPVPGDHPSIFEEASRNLKLKMSFALTHMDSALESAMEKDCD